MEEALELVEKGEGQTAFHMLWELAQQGNLDALYALRDNLGAPHQDHACIVVAYIISCVIVSKIDMDAKLEMDRLGKQLTEKRRKQAEEVAKTFLHQPQEKS